MTGIAVVDQSKRHGVDAWDSALHEFRRVLGVDYVTVATPALDAASQATFATTSRVLAILRPSDTAEVQRCVRVSNEFGIPIYPVSSGKNWGYGSRVPVRDAALLDLSRLNRIVDFNEELAYVTIEPGVTQRQLQAFLREHGSRLWMDATGASPDCSIIGNTMERGFGHTPMGDHCSNACGLQVVLPNGECIQTGFGRFAGNTVTPLSRWGVGPSLDGLFAQGNFGVVTRMTVWLMPAPEAFEAFFFSCPDDESLAGVVDAVRPLRLSGVLRSVMHVGNDYKVLAATSQYPWQQMGERTPLDDERMETIRRTLGIGRWNGSGGLYGTRAQVRDAKRRLRAALSGKVTRLQFVNDRLLGLMERFAGPFGMITGWDLRQTLRVLVPVYNLLKGVPSDATLSSAYWRKRSPVPASPDPDRDGCGLLWCSPVLPSTGAHARAVADIVLDTVLKHGFEPQMSFSFASERTLICVTTVSYDRDVPGEDQRAADCYRVLQQTLLDKGYPPYRLNVTAMNAGSGDSMYGTTLRTLKAAIDPSDILAPGRYVDGGRS